MPEEERDAISNVLVCRNMDTILKFRQILIDVRPIGIAAPEELAFPFPFPFDEAIEACDVRLRELGYD